jgi:hypothetical protein
MIPLSHPHSTIRRTGDPFERTTLKRQREGVSPLRKRNRKLPGGAIVTTCATIRYVPVRCVCGRDYDMMLTQWLHRCPVSCIRCKGKRLRARADHRRQETLQAYLHGFADGAAGRPTAPMALPRGDRARAYLRGHAYGCKQRARVSKTEARRLRLTLPEKARGAA